jgi:hypothetical protein
MVAVALTALALGAWKYWDRYHVAMLTYTEYGCRMRVDFDTRNPTETSDLAAYKAMLKSKGLKYQIEYRLSKNEPEPILPRGSPF